MSSTHSTQRADFVTVCPSCPERPYVQLKLPESVSRVKRILFKTLSHDQGFSNEQDRHRGSYESCYSYFEVAVVNEGDRERLPRKQLQANRHAVFEPYPHENVWSDDSSDVQVREWMKSLHGGDTVQIVPRARFLAWKNYVSSAEIIAHCQEIHHDNPMSPLSRVLSGLSQQGSAIYRKLDQSRQEIRLIHLLPGTIDERVRCRMSYVSLEDPDATPYECISYCWGGLQDSENILLFNEDLNEDLGPSSPTSIRQTLPITRKLDTALRHLRCQTGQQRTLWVDAICINQADLVERGQQVAKMRQIFAKATNVVVWVGESDDETTALLKAAHKSAENYNKDGALVVSLHNNKVENYLHRVHSSIKEVYDDWGALDFPLLQRDWFRRTWVIQEVFQARSALVQCGDIVVPWSLILRINLCMHRPSTWATPWRRSVIPEIFRGLFDDAKCIADPMGLKFKNPTRALTVDILDVLLNGMDLEASDPRDKIFALLGFLDPASTDDIGEEIKADYIKPLSQIFANFTRWWIRTHKSLRILSAVHVNSGRTWQSMSCSHAKAKDITRPTWSLWHDGRSSWAHATLAALDTMTYHASDRFARLLESAPDQIVLEGCLLGSIDTITHFPYFAQDEDLDDLRRVYTKLLEPTNARNIWTSSAFQLGEPDQSGEGISIAQNTLYDHAYSHIEFLEQTGGGIECHHPCLITTGEGDRGLCPPMARLGDIVVVLFGGRVPYILRESTPSEQNVAVLEKQYEFIGECYLQGYMKGLAMKQIADRHHARVSQVFHLV